MLLMIIPIAASNRNWWGEANSGANFAGNNGFIGFASNYGLITPNVTDYDQCSFSGSVYTPVADDFNIDGVNEFVTSTSTQLKIMSMNCEELYSITLDTELRAMPVILNSNHNAYPEIVVLQNTTLTFYEFNGNNFTKVRDKTYTTHSPKASDGLTCFSAPSTSCLIFDSGSRNVTVWKESTDSFSRVDTVLQANFVTPTKHSGIANSKIGTDYRAIVGNQFTSVFMKYDILDENGIHITSTSGINEGLSITSLTSQDIFFAKVGGITRIFETSRPFATSQHYYWGMKDVAGTEVTNYFSNTVCSTCSIGVWNVADYNKDGINEACIIAKNNSQTTAESYLKCFDSIGGTVVNIEIQDTLNLTTDIFSGSVMGDFLSGYSNLGFATAYGIYYVNSSNNLQLFYDSGIAKSTSRDGKLITVFGNSVGDPAIIYSDSSFGFVLSNAGDTVCGDGVCDGLENALVCPSDCSVNATVNALLNNTGDPCQKNSDCVSNYCGYGTCGLGNLNSVCTLNSQCLSGICHLGRCSKADLWTSIDASKTESFGDTSNTNNLLSLIIMIVVCGLLFSYGFKNDSSGAIAGGVLSFFMLGIFFGVVGWLSPFLIFGLVILFIAIIFVMLMFGGWD